MPAVTRGTLLSGMPDGLVDALLAVAGPHVDVPLAVVELRLMGGALARPAAVPNAVAGRDGAFALTVIAPAPPPLADVAPVVSAQVVEAARPWSTGSSLVNFLGHGDHDEPVGARGARPAPPGEGRGRPPRRLRRRGHRVRPRRGGCR